MEPVPYRQCYRDEHLLTDAAHVPPQVCGLKWSPDDREIASGGNDNQLYIWNLNSTSPVIKFSDHNAAVKAIAWSPHQHGLLASGGGTADRCIRFWNSATNTALNCIDTGGTGWHRPVPAVVYGILIPHCSQLHRYRFYCLALSFCCISLTLTSLYLCLIVHTSVHTSVAAPAVAVCMRLCSN